MKTSNAHIRNLCEEYGMDPRRVSEIHLIAGDLPLFKAVTNQMCEDGRFRVNADGELELKWVGPFKHITEVALVGEEGPETIIVPGKAEEQK